MQCWLSVASKLNVTTSLLCLTQLALLLLWLLQAAQGLDALLLLVGH